MQWVRLICDLQNVEKKDIFESILINMMRVNQWNLREMFDQISGQKNAEYWYKSSFDVINNNVIIGIRSKDLIEMFKAFTDGGKRDNITIKQMAQINKKLLKIFF
ncbi:hypothetical protein PPERSA_00291 [Pseudocohnilembus persalinus]|uniref:Uncharacterized protein n=1 Tax=Pseudocohnilembus persalinus TaxID=266149 RepID=A0A0V0Q990_PSEPJ|nr:hypothetical protein PPERSA_00291 [Pseudocohnilembus persalinus]|eukprot:KRW98703.1 hypothetical protein PPERSA_00291 [Pseudocohnilembus persalinus]